jgi:exosortase A-associated hydrolase 2
MNKSRRMAALQSRAFAAAGHTVLQIDLLGCGDSSGEFGDATWDDWIEDVVAAARWLRERCKAPLVLWGLRAGCLIATEAARRLDEPADFVFWQPITSGKAMLQQFLRLKLAAGMQGGAGSGLMDAIRAQLAAGETIEVAGYLLRAALAAGLEHAVLTPTARTGRVIWLEVSPRADAPLLPASAATVLRWQQAGFTVGATMVRGPAFWQTAEIEEAPALLDATLAGSTQGIAA